MIRRITMMLSAWYQDGRRFSGSEFASELQVELGGLTTIGDGRPWVTARIVLLTLEAAAFKEQEEPTAAFQARLEEMLASAARWLAQVKEDRIRVLKGKGLSIDLFVNLLLDQDQVDLVLPPSFLGELSRLGLSMAIVSND